MQIPSPSVSTEFMFCLSRSHHLFFFHLLPSSPYPVPGPSAMPPANPCPVLGPLDASWRRSAAGLPRVHIQLATETRRQRRRRAQRLLSARGPTHCLCMSGESRWTDGFRSAAGERVPPAAAERTGCAACRRRPGPGRGAARGADGPRRAVDASSGQ